MCGVCRKHRRLQAEWWTDIFDGEVPMEFWKLLALYISSNTLSSLPWAIPFGQGEIDVMKKQAADILDWYDGMTNVVPKWYRW